MEADPPETEPAKEAKKKTKKGKKEASDVVLA
jgi:hypothetical protein